MEIKGDFQIRVTRFGLIEQQIGETISLHSAFVVDNFLRIQCAESLQLDLYFRECVESEEESKESESKSAFWKRLGDQSKDQK